ncbi:hypothetical protein MMC13_007830 [Lambiella insularis]|nr:hypothetical protein [Lambiella insularis]
MKSVLVSTVLALLVTAVHAAPVPQVEGRQMMVQVTFQGATPSAQFTMAVPADGTPMTVTNPFSISHIVSTAGATCTFMGINNSKTVTVGAQIVDVGPPQTIVKGSCMATT